MALEILVKTGSGNGLLPDGTKPWPEPMLTYHQWGLVAFMWGQFHKRYLNHQSLKSVWKLQIYKISFKFPRGQWVKITDLVSRDPVCNDNHEIRAISPRSRRFHEQFLPGDSHAGCRVRILISENMTTSSNGNIFRVTGPLCGEFTGDRWIPITKASDAELWCFLWSAPWTVLNKRLTRVGIDYD